MPRRFTGSMAVALIAVTAGAAGCASAKPTASASVTPSASPTATANYWQTLNGINTELAADIGQIRSARTPTAVSAAVAAAESDVYLSPAMSRRAAFRRTSSRRRDLGSLAL